jgi:hypothetical protein
MPPVVRLLLALFALPALACAAPFDTVKLGPAKTSIYIGSVSLETPVLRRRDNRYTSTYSARVFPYFFYNEHGTFAVTFDQAQLDALARGERVNFTGEAINSDRETRSIEGFATPDAAGTPSGKIKVKILVSKKIELIFNTTYRFD